MDKTLQYGWQDMLLALREEDLNVSRMLTAGCEASWPFLCYQDDGSLEQSLQGQFAFQRYEKVSDRARNIRNKIELPLDACVPGLFPEDNELAAHAVSQIVTRIGLSLHLAASITDGKWHDILQTWNAEGNDYLKSKGISRDVLLIRESEAYWLRCNLSRTAVRKLEYSVTTNIALVNDAEEKGSLGKISVCLVDMREFGENILARQFVRHPQSFGYFLDAEFESAFNNVVELFSKPPWNIWPAHIAVEWNVTKGTDSTATLEGASAGAAIALATGNILARYCLAHPEDCQ